MTTWIKNHRPAAVAAALVLLLALGFAVLYSNADASREAALDIDPSPTPIIPRYPAAPLDSLAPALDATNPLEDTDAVRTIRATYAAIAWSGLANSEEFAQFSRYISTDNRQFTSMLREERFWYLSFQLGPVPFTPVDIRSSGEGTQIVTVCMTRSPVIYHPRQDRVDASDDRKATRAAFEVYPLSDRELVQLSNYDVRPGDLRMRMASQQAADVDCSDVDNVQQLFTDWQDHVVTWRPNPSPEATH